MRTGRHIPCRPALFANYGKTPTKQELDSSENRTPLNIVQGILGHSSIETTRKYLHKNTDIERDALTSMTDYLNADRLNNAPQLNGAKKEPNLPASHFLIFRSRGSGRQIRLSTIMQTMFRCLLYCKWQGRQANHKRTEIL